MKRSALMALVGVVYLALLAPLASANSGGGSGGGTDIDTSNGQLVDFSKVLNPQPIDPSTYEGIFQALEPKLQIIEQKIPDLGAQLQAVLTQKTWILTDSNFTAPKAGEDEPIFQDDDHVYLTRSKIAQMTPVQLQEAWLHEMVRSVVQGDQYHEPVAIPAANQTPNAWGSNGQVQVPYVMLNRSQVDDLVQKLTPVLFDEYNLPGDRLAQVTNEALGNSILYGRKGYMSRSDLYQRINEFALEQKYSGICQGVLGWPDSAKMKSLMAAFQAGGDSCSNWEDDKPATMGAFGKSCMPPQEKSALLATLNQMKTGGEIETDGHFTDSAFRADDISEVDENSSGTTGYDIDAYNALNFRPTNNATSANLSNLSQAEDFFSDAISGMSNTQAYVGGLSAPTKAALTDDERVGYALDACISLSNKDIDLINEAYANASQADSGALDTSTVSSLDHVTGAVRMSPPQGNGNPQSADGNPVKSSGVAVGQQGPSSAPVTAAR